jgi:hypothetical protein
MKDGQKMEHLLPIEEISRITLLYLNGDDFESVLLEKIGHTDYDFAKFNRLKKVLLAVPLIDPSQVVDAILWQSCCENRRVGSALVAGTSLPHEGCKRVYLNPQIMSVLNGGRPCQKDWGNDQVSYYAPLRNSNDEIVGVLELQTLVRDKKDVSCVDMFVPPYDPNDEEEAPK